MSQKYYLTTPIYYVNAAPHIGHAYTTIVADTIKRYRQMHGDHVVLTTGSDEHGVNVERAAERLGIPPKQFTDIVAREFKEQWEKLGLSIDRFMRTSDPKHHAEVGKLFEACKANGYVYKGQYTGQFCQFDNLFANEAGPGDPCPICGRPTETVTEENYFFKLSAFTEKLIEFHESNPEWCQPEIRRNEVLAFLRQGLSDLSITRTSINWGIPVPGEPGHVFYVWFDALMTYYSAVAGEGLWPADLHLIGKEILRFHAIYWPAFLMAAEWPLPKRVFAHGWLLFENEKMSKSRGNIVRATPIQQVMGADALRYFLLREVPFGQDGSFSFDALVGRYNSDLANGLGNLASRTLTMIKQYRDGKAPQRADVPGVPEEAMQVIEAYKASFDRFEFHRALEQLWGLISRLDRAIVEYQPWKLSKETDEASQRRLDEILYSSAETLRIVTALIAPVLPETAAKLWSMLGMTTPAGSTRIDSLAWGGLESGQPIGEIAGLFPRADAKTTIEKMRELEEVELARQNVLMGKTAAAAEKTAWMPPPGVPPPAAKITIDDFGKVDLRVALVLAAEPVKGADKLLKLTVDVAEEQPRTIVAGIAKAYTPEQMVGRKVVIVANLEPRKLRGIESNGMIVAGSLEDGPPVLAAFLEDVPVGARLK